MEILIGSLGAVFGALVTTLIFLLTITPEVRALNASVKSVCEQVKALNTQANLNGNRITTLEARASNVCPLHDEIRQKGEDLAQRMATVESELRQRG